MNKLIFILLPLLIFSSCKSSKEIKSNNEPNVIIKAKTSGKVDNENINTVKSKVANSNSETPNVPAVKSDNIVDYAKQFLGVRYKFAGATREGMDCSGLVFESFRAHDIILPRSSRDMAKNGEKLLLKDVEKGDLLFFKTNNRRNDISHVGLVVSSKNGDIQFIHSSTSAGVIISSMAENYWDKTFVEARRIL
jgi:cell wall-associated NlpC family hydrolase